MKEVNKPRPPYDICMCVNKECCLRDTCKRNPDHYDMRGTITSYADLYDGKMCSNYWKIERREDEPKFMRSLL